MSPRDRALPESAADLRREFDRTFAEAPREEAGDFENVLGVRIADDPYALRASDVAGLFKDRRVMAAPSAAPQLLGLAGLHGIIVPVYDLGSFLGHPTRQRSPRWLVVAAGPDPVAFAFDGFEGQFRVSREQIVSAGTDAQRQSAGRAVRTGGVLRPIVEVGSLLAAIRDRARQAGPAKER